MNAQDYAAQPEDAETPQEVPTESAEVETAEPTPNVISVQNPSTEEMTSICADIKANFDFDVNVKPVKFSFKKTKDKDTGVEIIREAVQLAIPYLSVQGIITVLQDGGKELELLLEAIENVVNAAARELLYDDTTLNAATFPADKISWKAIANMPKAQRRGGGIPKETWDAFALDYASIMPEAAGKRMDQIEAALKVLMNKFANAKTNTPVLTVMIEQLTIYADASENIEEHSECVAFLLNKAETYLNVSPEELLGNL